VELQKAIVFESSITVFYLARGEKSEEIKER